MIKIENPNKSKNPQPPLPSPFTKMQNEIKASFEEFKKKHNQIAEGMKDLEAQNEELKAEFAEIKEFLTFTSKRYRKFYHKKHLKSKFK